MELAHSDAVSPVAMGSLTGSGRVVSNLLISAKFSTKNSTCHALGFTGNNLAQRTMDN